MKRKIIKINQKLCNGCGLCVDACHEGAIGLQNGKAVLLRDDYCDGLGDCLPACPTGAITFEEREAAAYDKAAVEKKRREQGLPPLPCGCPGTQMKSIARLAMPETPVQADAENEAGSELRQWPVQIKLVPPTAPYFDNCNLLIAADCTAYAFAAFHERFIKGKITLIGCPKLDDTDYAEKLTAILSQHPISSITVCRMEVPCCSGIASAVERAVSASNAQCPVTVYTISTDGTLLTKETK